MKKLAPVLAAVAAILAVVIAALYFFSPGEAIDVGGAESPYPYSCEMKHQKLHFFITGDFPEGYMWTAESDNEFVLRVQGKVSSEDKVDFTLVPKGNGLSKVTFTLEKEGDLPDRLFRIECAFLLGIDGKVEEADSSCFELPKAVSGEGDDFAYSITRPNPGTLQIYVSGGGDWSCERVGARAELNGSAEKKCVLLSVNEEQTLHEVEVVGTNYEGDGTLYIDSGDGKGHIELTYHCTDRGALTLTGHKLGNGERPASESDTFEEQYGVGGRLDFLVGEQSVESWRSRADDATELPVGVILFENYGTWRLYVSREAAEADFVGTTTPVGQVTEAGITANIYKDAKDNECACSVWQMGELTYMLESTESFGTLCEDLTTMIVSSLAVEETTEAPTEAPVEAPTEAPVEAPTETPVEAPTEAPAEVPVEAPTEAPAEAPTEAPVEATAEESAGEELEEG